MMDININEIREYTRKAEKLSFNFDLSSNGKFNLLNDIIFEAAREGKNFIEFEIIYMGEKTHIDDQEKKQFRIFAKGKAWPYSEYDVLYYPLYLVNKGFNVEMRKSAKEYSDFETQPLLSLSYFISW